METNEGTFRHDTARVAGMIGNGISRQVIRRWARTRRITGFYQREENAKLWLNDDGVLAVWALWAEYQDLDFERDMPRAVRKLAQRMKDKSASAAAGGKENSVSVTITLPPGANVQIVQQA